LFYECLGSSGSVFSGEIVVKGSDPETKIVRIKNIIEVIFFLHGFGFRIIEGQIKLIRT
jgi:hypothetical protein